MTLPLGMGIATLTGYFIGTLSKGGEIRCNLLADAVTAAVSVFFASKILFQDVDYTPHWDRLIVDGGLLSSLLAIRFGVPGIGNWVG